MLTVEEHNELAKGYVFKKGDYGCLVCYIESICRDHMRSAIDKFTDVNSNDYKETVTEFIRALEDELEL